MSRVILICVLLTLIEAAVAQVSAPQQTSPASAPAGATASETAGALRPVLVIGFRADEKLDSRDTWMPTAVEETLSGRLRRVPTLTVIPTPRAHQARRELAERDDAPPISWSRVAPLLGAKLWLRGSCAGTPDKLVLDLELSQVERTETRPRQVRLGPGRLFAVSDDATRWVLGELGIPRISDATEKLVFAPPAQSPSALEYYAKALSAARGEDFRNAAYYIERAVDYDPSFRPVLLLAGKLALRGPTADRAQAGAVLRRVKQLADDQDDALDEAELELTQGLLLMSMRSFDAARQRFNTALALASRRDDVYGQTAALDALCDLWLSYEPAARSEMPEDEQRRLRLEDLRHAAEYQRRVLKILGRLGDVIAEVPAANKLALIYEKLEEPGPALETHQRALAAARKTGSLRNQATACLFLGQWYRQQEHWSEALDTVTQCLNLVPDEAKPQIYIMLAEIHTAMSAPRQALDQYEAARQLLAESDDLTNLFRCLRGAAELHMELGEREAAISNLTEALDVAEALQLPETQALRDQLAEWKHAKP